MRKKELKKEIERLNKIIDALLVNQNVVQKTDAKGVSDSRFTVTTTNDYIGGRPNDRP